jgi:hypothetical protein
MRFYEDLIALVVGLSGFTSTERARTIFFRCRSIIVARELVGTSIHFQAIARAIAIGIYTVASAYTADVKRLTCTVGSIVVVASSHIRTSIQFIADSISISITQAVAIAIVERCWEFTLRLVIVDGITIEIARSSIQATCATFELTRSVADRSRRIEVTRRRHSATRYRIGTATIVIGRSWVIIVRFPIRASLYLECIADAIFIGISQTVAIAIVFILCKIT